MGPDVCCNEKTLYKYLNVNLRQRPALLYDHVNIDEPPGSSVSGIAQDPLPAEVRRGECIRQQPKRFRDYEVSILNVCEASLCESNEAENEDSWREAKVAELKSMKQHNVWTLVPKRSDKKEINLRWVLQGEWKAKASYRC